MATGETRRQAFEFIVVESCIVCSEFKQQRSAESYCMDCKLYLCGECLIHHNKHEMLVNHHILHTTTANKMEYELPADSQMTTKNAIACEEHNDRVIEMYCADHDNVCCSLCTALFHKLCTDIDYLSNVTTKTETSKAKKRIQTSLKQNLKILNQLKASRQQQTENLINVRSQESKDAQGAKKRRSTRLQAKEKKPSGLGKVMSNESRKDTNKEISLLDEMITNTESKLKIIALDNYPVDDFVHIKQGEKLALKGKTLIGQLSNSGFGNSSKDTTEQVQTICKATNTFVRANNECIPNQPFLVGEYDIMLSNDTLQCFVKDICVLEEDQLVISDSSNYKLKLLDSAFKITGSCDLPGQPGVMCKTGPTEVACIVKTEIGNPYMQFASASETLLMLTNSVDVETDKYSNSLCCLQGELFVISSDYIFKVYDKSGSDVRSFFCAELKGCSVMANIRTYGSDLIVTDGLKRIYILDTHGNRKAKITDKKFNGLSGLCAEDTGEIFVCSYYANTVFLMDKTGKNKKEILGKQDGIAHPQAIAYLRNSNCLVVGSYGTIKIQVFKL